MPGSVGDTLVFFQSLSRSMARPRDELLIVKIRSGVKSFWYDMAVLVQRGPSGYVSWVECILPLLLFLRFGWLVRRPSFLLRTLIFGTMPF